VLLVKNGSKSMSARGSKHLCRARSALGPVGTRIAQHAPRPSRLSMILWCWFALMPRAEVPRQVRDAAASATYAMVSTDIIV